VRGSDHDKALHQYRIIPQWMEVSPEQIIIKEAILWGWDTVQEHVDENLFFFATKGSDFATIIRDQLPRLVEARKQYETPTRVVIDPLTPIIWAQQDKITHREESYGGRSPEMVCAQAPGL